jgi:hypothetical protein
MLGEVLEAFHHLVAKPSYECQCSVAKRGEDLGRMPGIRRPANMAATAISTRLANG